MSRRLYRRLSAPISAQLEVTQACNNRCCHCYNHWRDPEDKCSDAQNEKMSIDTATLVAEQCIKCRIFDFVITGGEPFLNFPVMNHLLIKAKEADVHVSINSNLTCITDKHAQCLAATKTGVLASILGPNEEVHDHIVGRKGAFVEALRGFRLCVNRGITPVINMVVTTLNHTYVKETAIMLASEGCRHMTVTRAVCPGYANEFSSLELNREQFVQCLNDIYWAKKRFGFRVDTLNSLPLCGLYDAEDPILFSSRRCGAGTMQVVISANGEVRSCPHVDIAEGSLYEQPLSDIWDKMSNWGEKSILPEECQNCPLLIRCGGGCRFAAKMSCGSFCGHDPLMDKSRIPVLQDAVRVNTTSDAPSSGQFRVNYFRMREELFGSIVAIGQYHNNTILLDQRGTGLITSLKPGTQCDVEAWKEVRDGYDFLNGLAARGLITFLS